MTYAPPILVQPIHQASERQTVYLSSLGDTLKVLVPDTDDFPANWDVYPILGGDPQLPDWTGLEVPTGVWDDAVDDLAKLSGIELQIPIAVLEKYSEKEVYLRYKFADESSMEPYSAPLTLYIEA